MGTLPSPSLARALLASRRVRRDMRRSPRRALHTGEGTAKREKGEETSSLA